MHSAAQLNLPPFPWVLALFALIYHLIRHRRPQKVLEEVIGNLIGFYLVSLSAFITPYSLEPLSRLMQAAFGVDGGVMNSEVFAAELLPLFSSVAFPILLLSFGVNLLLARLGPARGVYLTVHHSLYLALFTGAFLELFTPLPAWGCILLGALVLGVWEFATVSFTTPVLRQVTGTRDTGMANSCAGASLIGAVVGRIFGRGSEPYDDSAPDCAACSIPVLACAGALAAYLIPAIRLGPAVYAQVVGSEGFYLLNCLIRALLYGAQVALLLNGIRLLVSGFVSMGWSVAPRAVPNGWIGLDATALISYSPRAWRTGYICCALGALGTCVVLILLRLPFVPLPSFTSYYFVGGVAGVCGNAYGGRRGARLAGLITGVASTLLVCAMMCTSGLMPGLGVAYGETEYGLYGLFLHYICRLFH